MDRKIDIMVADASHEKYVDTILETIRVAAKKRGTGIAGVCLRRRPSAAARIL